MAKRPTFIPPPQELKRKAVNFKRGFSLQLEPEVVQKLEQVVEKATDNFTVEVAEKLKQLRVALGEIGGGAEAKRYMREIRSTSLEIKGMGAMFKFPLLTAFAKSLNDFVQGMDDPTDIQLDIIAAQIDALYVVMANRIQGGGGKTESQLLDALAVAARKYKD
ncbi:hypothetical protein [Ferrovibrio sp.]|uniref:hypothetical protein n=1 Tax=Ferrovibrio sp. TaxID=1917215 RepID=UPI0025C2C91D|nr:hypothetical protein [Ferrovibrio sp.]MBX3454926.1 hypothetical protein [Ferrovibrio sp.]